MMKLEKLNSQIKTGKLLPVYFFYGDEQYLLSRKTAAIAERLIPPGMEDFNRFYFEGKKTDLDTIIEAVEQFPQMSPKKVVIVKNSGFFHQTNTSVYRRIQEMMLDLPEYTCLIWIEEHFDKKKEKNVQFIEECGGVVAFDYLPVNQIEIWLEERFRREEKQIAPRDLTYMVRLCGPGLGKIQTEYEKLLNYMGDRNKISREDIDAVVDQTVEYRVYDMLNNIMAKKGSLAREQMKYLKDSREQPTVVLGLMMAKIAELLTCRQLKETGMSAQEIGEYFDLKRPLFAINKTIEDSRRFEESYLVCMLKRGLDGCGTVSCGINGNQMKRNHFWINIGKLQ